MKRSRFSDQQIAFALQQGESGTPVGEICRKMGISEQTFYRWRKQYGGMGAAQLKELKRLQKENERLRRAVSDLTLDKLILAEAARGRHLKPRAPSGLH